MDSLRGEMRREELKVPFLGTRTGPHEDLVRLLARLGRWAEAFEAAQRGRARGLLDLMANQRLRLRGADLEELGRELEEARDAIAALYRDLHRDGGRTPQERADILRKMADRQERERKLWEEIKAKSPLWAALQPVHPPRLEEIVSGLPQGSAVVELFSSPREVYVFLLTPEGLARALALDLPRSTVVGWVALTRA